MNFTFLDRVVTWIGDVDSKNLEKTGSEIYKLWTTDNNSPIIMALNSDGGEVNTAFAFYDSINSMVKINLTTVIAGSAGSSAVILFLAGKKRFITEHSTIFFHRIVRGRSPFRRLLRVLNIFKIRRNLKIRKETNNLERTYAEIMAKNSGGKITIEKALELMKKEVTITPEQALEMGLVHGILREENF